MAAGQGPSRETGTQDPAPAPIIPDGLTPQANLPAVQGAAATRQLRPARKTTGNGLKDLEIRAADAETPAEALEWTRVRGELSQQLQEESEGRKRLFAGLATIGVSVASITAGTVLTLYGHQQVGVFVLGAGLYGIAPDYVLKFIGRFIGGGR